MAAHSRLYDQAPGGERSERCELLISLGEAQRQSGDPEFRQTLLDAAGLAQELSDTDRLCRAVLANNRGWTSQVGTVDAERVQALEATAQALPDDDPRRAQVLALLGLELHYSGDPQRCRRLAAEAVEIARAAGDPAALAHTLVNACWAIWVPDMLAERRRLTAELVALAARLNDPWLSFWAASRQWEVGIESGDRSQAESALTAMRALAATVPQPSFVWLWLLDECAWAHLQGDLESSEQWAIRAFEFATAAGELDAAVLFGAQLFSIRHQQGRSGELVEQLVQLAGDPSGLPAWRAAAALCLIESGREAEARGLALAEDFQSVPWDAAWWVSVFPWADACSRLGLRDRARDLYELLAPFSGHLASGGFLVLGSIAWSLGTLASTLERYEQAELHFAAAAETEASLGAPLFLARTRVSWARALIARGRPEDRDRAQSMLEQAEQAADRLGAEGVAREVAECRTTLAAIGA